MQQNTKQQEDELNRLGEITKSMANDNKSFHTKSIDGYVNIYNSVQTMDSNMPDDVSPMVKEQLGKVSGIMLDNQTASVKDQAKSRDQLNSVIDVLENVVEKSPSQEQALKIATEAKEATEANSKAYNKIGESLTDHLVDGFGAMVGAATDSPLIAMTAQFIGNKIKETKDKRLENLNIIRNSIIERQAEILSNIDKSINNSNSPDADVSPDNIVIDTSEQEQPIPDDMIRQIQESIADGTLDEDELIEGFREGMNDSLKENGIDADELKDFIDYSVDELKNVVEQLKQGNTITSELFSDISGTQSDIIRPTAEEEREITGKGPGEIESGGSDTESFRNSNTESLDEIESSSEDTSEHLDNFFDSTEENRREENSFRKKLLKKQGKSGKTGKGGAGAAAGGGGFFGGMMEEAIGHSVSQKFIQPLMIWMGTFFTGIFSGLSGMLTTIVSGAGKIFLKAIPKFLGKIALFPIMLGISLLQGLRDALKTFNETGSIAEAVIAFGGAIVEFFTFGFFDAETLRSIGSAIGLALFDLVDWFTTDFPVMFGNMLSGIFDLAWKAMSGIAGFIWDQTGQVVIDIIKEIFTLFGIDIGQVFTDAWSTFKDDISFISDIFQTYVIDPVVNFFNTMGEFFNDIFDSIANFDFSTLLPDFITDFFGIEKDQSKLDGPPERLKYDSVGEEVYETGKESITKSITEKDEDNSGDVTSKAKEDGLIETVMWGESKVHDWKKINKLPLNDIKALYAHDDWSDEDNEKFKKAIDAAHVRALIQLKEKSEIIQKKHDKGVEIKKIVSEAETGRKNDFRKKEDMKSDTEVSGKKWDTYNTIENEKAFKKTQAHRVKSAEDWDRPAPSKEKFNKEGDYYFEQGLFDTRMIQNVGGVNQVRDEKQIGSPKAMRETQARLQKGVSTSGKSVVIPSWKKAGLEKPNKQKDMQRAAWIKNKTGKDVKSKSMYGPEWDDFYYNDGPKPKSYKGSSTSRGRRGSVGTYGRSVGTYGRSVGTYGRSAPYGSSGSSIASTGSGRTNFGIPSIGNYKGDAGDGGMGSISAKYESGGRGAGTVSSGKGDFGGVSYGTHQLSSKAGTLQKFLKGSEYGSQFEGLEPGSPEFSKKWKEVASGDENFGGAQHDFIKQTHYDPQMAKLKEAGIDIDSMGSAAQEAVWSTSVQYGGNTSKIIDSMKGKDTSNMSGTDFVTGLQDYKAANVGTHFKSSSANVQAGVAKRIQREKADLIARAEQDKMGGMDSGNLMASLEPMDNSTAQLASISSESSGIENATSGAAVAATAASSSGGQGAAAGGGRPQQVKNKSAGQQPRSNDTKGSFDEDRVFLRISDKQYAY